MQRLQPGFYADGSGALHVSTEEILDYYGLPLNYNNDKELAVFIKQLFWEFCPKTRITVEPHGN